MKLLSIDFTTDNDGDAYPRTVTVEMSISDALVIAEIYGQMNGIAHQATGATGDVYDCLVGSVFNRYWDDGTNDARRAAGGRRVDITAWREALNNE